MALYGKQGGLNMGTVGITSVTDNVVVFNGSIASYNVENGDTLILDRGGTPEYVKVKTVDSATQVTLWNNPSTTAGAGKHSELLEAPKYVHENDEGNVIGVDTTETGSNAVNGKIAHAGWVKTHTKDHSATGGSNHTWYETLVASSSITGDIEGTDVG